MNKKRIFQVFDEMSLSDEANGTSRLGACYDMVTANAAKGGGHVTMGVPAEVLTKIMSNEYKPILILLDYKEYKRLEAIPLEDKLQAGEQRIEQLRKALKEIQAMANKGIFPHLPIETMGARMCINIDEYITSLLTLNPTTNE